MEMRRRELGGKWGKDGRKRSGEGRKRSGEGRNPHFTTAGEVCWAVAFKAPVNSLCITLLSSWAPSLEWTTQEFSSSKRLPEDLAWPKGLTMY